MRWGRELQADGGVIVHGAPELLALLVLVVVLYAWALERRTFAEYDALCRSEGAAGGYSFGELGCVDRRGRKVWLK